MASVNFVLFLYPPFQVPLGYLGLALLAGSLPGRLTRERVRVHLAFRAASAALAAFAIGAALAAFYVDARETVALVRATVYPGGRIAVGGEMTLARLFSGLFGFFMSEGSFPREWQNVCESSNFVLPFPVCLGILVWRLLGRQPVGAVPWSLALYILALLAWMLWGFPAPIARLSQFAHVQDTRALVGLGLASIFWCCQELAEREAARGKLSPRQQAVATSLCIALLLLYGVHFNAATGGFASWSAVLAVCAVGGSACFCLLDGRTAAFAACVLVPNLAVHGLVNPVALGLGPITGSRVYRETARVVEADPQGLWIVYGHAELANLFKAAGARVFNGTLFVPPLEELRLLDPAGQHEAVYNRYAHVWLLPSDAPTVAFHPTRQPDLYAIGIDPTHGVWRSLRARYVVIPSEFRPSETAFQAFLREARLVFSVPEDDVFVYRYVDAPGLP
jgi:hypothetical protein